MDKAATIRLVEGERRVLEFDAAEGPDLTNPGRAFPRRCVLLVVKVVGEAALLHYFPSDGTG